MLIKLSELIRKRKDMLIKSRELILISAEPVEFKDKESGEMLKKWKYIFLSDKKDEKGEPIFIKGWDTLGVYKDDVQSVDLTAPFDSKKAKIYTFELREWNGQMTEKLMTGAVKVKSK